MGYGSSVVAAIVGSYYNVIIAWCLFYLISSMQTSLPWSNCPLSSPNTTVTECELSSETQYFWFRKTLDSSDSIGKFNYLLNDPVRVKRVAEGASLTFRR